MSDYKTGFRLVFGDGKKAFHGGFIEETPSLIVSNLGKGAPGEDLPTDPGLLPNGSELAAFIFNNIESVEAALIELNRVRDHFIRRQEPVNYPTDKDAVIG